MNTPLHISDDLLVKYMLEEAMPDEQLLVREWLQADAANRKYYEHFKTIWNESKTLAANIIVDEKAAWQRFKDRIQTTRVKQEAKTIRLSRIRKLQVAAAVLVFVVGAWLLYNTLHQPATVAMMNKQTFSNTAIDTLPDGSVITLNKNTVLHYPTAFKGKTRTVQLKGEAFFAVAHDTTKPFIVQADGVSIRVVGTAFNVKNYDSSIQVIVENGIVQVSNAKQSVLLHKGEQVFIKDSNSEFAPSTVTDSLYNYYRTKEIICNNTPLPAVIATINEVYNAHIVLGSDALKQFPLTTTFKNEDLETVISIIQQTFDLRVTQQGDSTILNFK
ncbi:MAG TPA: FecR domain-containing protein [Parafilimonas sp.]|nr:FecR domain-containing protein [Parafilimonas sp.]